MDTRPFPTADGIHLAKLSPQAAVDKLPWASFVVLPSLSFRHLTLRVPNLSHSLLHHTGFSVLKDIPEDITLIRSFRTLESVGVIL